MRNQAQSAHHDRFYDQLYRTENYFGHRQLLYRPYIRSLITLAGIPRGAEILDAGCGQGFFAHLFAEEGMTVYATDASLVGLRAAQTLYRHPSVRLFACDLSCPPTTHKFDVLFVRSCSLYNTDQCEQWRKTTASLTGLLKDGGLFIFAYNTNLSGHANGWRHHRLEEIRTFLAHSSSAFNLYFINRLDSLLLKDRAFSERVTRINKFISEKTRVGGEAIALFRSPRPGVMVMNTNEATMTVGAVPAVDPRPLGMHTDDDEFANGYSIVRIRGQNVRVPSRRVAGATVVVPNRFLKIARVKDEMFQPGQPVEDPEFFVREIKSQKLPAHVFKFSQKPPDSTPRYGYFLEWDNVAIVRSGDYTNWWEEQLSQQTRKNVRRAHRMGVVVKEATVDDEFVRGVVEIYNESPVRQGKPFYHYGKGFETIKRELSTFRAASDFIGAYKDTELIGFIKLVHTGDVASIMHIVSKNAHSDKRPTNALIAEAVALCSRKGVNYLVYDNYTYGRKANSSLAEFKRRNGFEKMMIPTYYIPLTLTGRVIVALKLHRGIIGLLPSRLISVLLALREKALKATVALRRRA